MFIIPQEEYNRIQQNKEGNLEIVPKNAEPPSVDRINREVEVKTINDGVTTTEHEKDLKTSKDKELADAMRTALPTNGTKSSYRTQNRKTMRFIAIGASSLLLLYLLFFWKPATK